MPVLSMFYGIIIRMYWRDNDRRKKPHFHAYYGEREAVFDFDGEIISGEFPAKQSAIVKAWALLNKEDLEANWELAVNGEELFKIRPLQ